MASRAYFGQDGKLVEWSGQGECYIEKIRKEAQYGPCRYRRLNSQTLSKNWPGHKVSNMSLVGVHPRNLHSNHSSLSSLSYSLDDIASCCSPHFNSEHVMTIEELRLQMSSCFTCGVSWAEYHVSLDCSECGGYALERPCPTCEGSCGAVWKRELTKSHASNKAHWEGECKHLPKTVTSTTTKSTSTSPQPEKPHLS